MRGLRPFTVVRLLAILALVGSAEVARAEPSPADIATARRLFAESTELRAASRWSEAAAKLREALAIKETAGLRFHLAHCEEKLGLLVLAERDYDRANELILAGAKAKDVAALLATARAALAERVPSLLVKIPPDVPRTTVSIDGSPLASAEAGKPIPLDPGSHTVTVVAPARAPFSLEVRLAEGEDRVVEATLAPSAPAGTWAPKAPSKPAPMIAPRAPTERPHADPHADVSPAASTSTFGAREVLLIGEGAVALGGAAVGVIFLVKRGEAGDRFDAAGRAIGTNDHGCVAPVGDVAAECRALGDALDERAKDGTIAAVGFIGSGVGLASAALTWLLWPKTGRSDHAVRVAPALGGASVHGVF